MILNIIFLFLAIPVGFLIAWLARDELLIGKKYFRALIIVSLGAILWFWLTKESYLAWTFGFILIVSIVSLVKAEDKKWTKKKL